ncbi:MAG TPA: hypothetical protein VGA36_01620 [Nitriliruptorales bacterium]|jgi:hypothetical protein
MHPIHSDLVAHVVAEDRRRAAAARHVPTEAADTASTEDDRAPSAAQALFGWFRGRARIELRHHA